MRFGRIPWGFGGGGAGRRSPRESGVRAAERVVMPDKDIGELEEAKAELDLR